MGLSYPSLMATLLQTDMIMFPWVCSVSHLFAMQLVLTITNRILCQIWCQWKAILTLLLHTKQCQAMNRQNALTQNNQIITIKLDGLTAPQHLKSPLSLSRSLHLTLVTNRSWSWMTGSHPSCSMSSPWVWSKVKVTLSAQQLMVYFFLVSHQSTLPFLRYSHLKILPWKSKAMTKVKNSYI